MPCCKNRLASICCICQAPHWSNSSKCTAWPWPNQSALVASVGFCRCMCAEDAWFNNLTISANDAKYLPANSSSASAILAGLDSTSDYQPAFNCTVSFSDCIACIQAACFLRILTCSLHCKLLHCITCHTYKLTCHSVLFFISYPLLVSCSTWNVV